MTYGLIFIVLVIGCSENAEVAKLGNPAGDQGLTDDSESTNCWAVTEVDRFVAQVMMADDTCMTVFGTEVRRSGDLQDKLLLLSWKPFSQVDWQVDDEIIVEGLEAAELNQSFSGYWADSLTIHRSRPAKE